MKDYCDYKDFESFNKDFVNEFTAIIKGAKVISPKYNDGTIIAATNLKLDLGSADIVISAKFDSVEQEVNFLFRAAQNCLRPLKISGIDDTAVNKYFVILDSYYSNWKNESLKKLELQKAERLEEQKEKKELLKQEKLKIKFEKQKESNLRNANKLEYTKLKTSDAFYTSLGYIAKHAKKISAAMPDYMEGWFIKNFGTEAEKSLVDSNKITVSGNPMQWTLSLQITLDTNNNIPVDLEKYLGKTTKEIQPISNTEFVFGLVKDYGFEFGKKQNLDKILENIPVNCLDSFNVGYAL